MYLFLKIFLGSKYIVDTSTFGKSQQNCTFFFNQVYLFGVIGVSGCTVDDFHVFSLIVLKLVTHPVE